MKRHFCWLIFKVLPELVKESLLHLYFLPYGPPAKGIKGLDTLFPE